MKHNIPLFVYGSLKQDYCLAHYLKNCYFVASVRLIGNFALYLHSDGFPCIIPSESQEQAVQGEFYLVPNQEVLREIDAIEEHPEVYKRELQKVLLPDGANTPAYAYIFQDRVNLQKARKIVSGCYIEAQDKGSQTRRQQTLALQLHKMPSQKT